ncbi:HlyD family efflux transporter periplasmic adaptor subunit [Thiothrix nivea]|uniref:HlyD family efflux transporter periplasmic adaptor subunit n=1 Tax=Thiothrix nivea TaxID=1031 RepID=UPI0002EE03D5|nr:HlyD family efflux transporter periplasmic adaptor subunit [Thiothrix nivea]
MQAEGAQAATQIRSAQLKLAQAQLDLSHTVITAPTDGILGEVNIQPGDYITIGEDLFPMIDSSSVWAVISPNIWAGAGCFTSTCRSAYSTC